MIPELIRQERERRAVTSRSAFTLIELMVVIAIITLLISILLPSLSKARDRAKDVKTRAMLKSIADGLELFRNENESDTMIHAVNGYPRSAIAENPVANGDQYMVGAQWLVHYLMGADLAGYAPRRNVPAALLAPPGSNNEEAAWYGYDTQGRPLVDRVGPYVDYQAIKIVRTLELHREGPNNPCSCFGDLDDPVFVDQYGFPVLYYVANPLQAGKPRANIASYDGSVPGIYTMSDNALFTGQRKLLNARYDGWNFGETADHPLGSFGANDPPDPNRILDDVKTFPCYILNRPVYDASLNPCAQAQPTTVPMRKDSFLLITAGKNGIYGDQDDVSNFR